VFTGGIAGESFIVSDRNPVGMRIFDCMHYPDAVT
jgi:hypothetical protein